MYPCALICKQIRSISNLMGIVSQCNEISGVNVLSYIVFNFGQMVRNFRTSLLELLESGDIDLCFANEDEAAELVR